MAARKQVLLRTSRSLHRQAALRAKADGVSLNQWVMEAIAEAVGARGAAERIEITVIRTASNDPSSYVTLTDAEPSIGYA